MTIKMPTIRPGEFKALYHICCFPRRGRRDLFPDAQERFRRFLHESNRVPAFVRDCIEDLQLICHGASFSAGWWHDPETGDGVGSVPEKIALIHSELSEALEADRKDLMDDKLPERPGIEVELADALIRIFDLAGALDIDLAGAFVDKLQYNFDREDHKIENRRALGGKKY